MGTTLFTVPPIPGLEKLAPDPVVSVQQCVPITASSRAKFWSRVHIDTGGCWVWTGAVGDDGYGRITWTHHGQSRTLSTHRFALHLAFGPVLPPGLVAAHGCDHQLCIRVGINHVHLSTQSKNLTHAVSVGRHVGTSLVVDSTRRRDESLSYRAALTGRPEPPSLPPPGNQTLF